MCGCFRSGALESCSSEIETHSRHGSVAWCCASLAGPTPPPVRAEIDALLATLQASGCRFSRNGSWYSASEAKDHLLRKLRYIERKGTIGSAEQFITLAASKSSVSGKAYRVKCGNELPVESREWLSRQLTIIRGTPGKPSQ
jgi:hypothetical protein